MDEISPTESQRWVNSLEDKGFREATVKSYVTLMAKVFNYFIETTGEMEGKTLQMCLHLEEGDPGPGPPSY